MAIGLLNILWLISAIWCFQKSIASKKAFKWSDTPWFRCWLVLPIYKIFVVAIGDTIRIRREIQCLPYARFLRCSSISGPGNHHWITDLRTRLCPIATTPLFTIHFFTTLLSTTPLLNNTIFVQPPLYNPFCATPIFTTTPFQQWLRLQQLKYTTPF